MGTTLTIEALMRNPVLIIITVLFLQSCSALDFLPGSVPSSSPAPSATATPTVTLTPTRTATLTPRATVTPIGDIPTSTPFVLVSADAPTSAFTPTPYEPGGGFASIAISQGRIFYGVCKQNYTKMTIRVENPVEVETVYLFFRLESGKRPGDTTPWTGTVTDNDGGGVYLYTLRANNIPERRNFIRAWVQYQLVAADADKNIIGRSQIYTRNIVLEPCK
jgi:hypothetical protein